MSGASEMRIEYVELSEIARWPGNPKSHDAQALDASIAQFGFNDPLTVDERTSKLVEGHGRLERLQARKARGEAPPARIIEREGKWYVPVVRGVSFANDAEAEAYLLTHNRAEEMGGWAAALLAEAFARITQGGAEVIGWSADYIAELTEHVADPDAGAQDRTPDQILDKYVNAKVKQVTLYFDGTQYGRVVERMQAAAKAEGTESNAELFIKLLDAYEAAEAGHGPPG